MTAEEDIRPPPPLLPPPTSECHGRKITNLITPPRPRPRVPPASPRLRPATIQAIYNFMDVDNMIWKIVFYTIYHGLQSIANPHKRGFMPSMYSCHIKYVIHSIPQSFSSDSLHYLTLTKSRKGRLVSLCCSCSCQSVTHTHSSKYQAQAQHLSVSVLGRRTTDSSPQGGARLRGSYRTSTPRLRLPASAEISSGHFLV